MVLRNALAVQNECETIEQLAEKNIFFSAMEIEPNDNFLLDNKGLTWIYDPYEIAPYAYGAVSVSLPWSKLVDMIDDESSVKAFAQSKTTVL